jgi:hypothetical protein
VKLWHTLRRETTGAWRSVRYDLDIHRAAKLAGAFTEEFEPAGPAGGAPSRLVPLAGVGLLLVGGAAGAVLAIGGGLSALGADNPLPFADRPAAAAPDGPGTAPQPGLTGAARPLTPGRPGSRTSPAPGPSATAHAPVPEASALPVTPEPSTSGEPTTPPTSSAPSPSGSGSPPSPAPSESERHEPDAEADGDAGSGPDDEYDPSGAPAPGR